METLIQSLKQLQADVATMYSQAHGYHWNVEGILFTQYHKFFEDIYSDVYDSIDPISENIRKLGGYAQFSLHEWANTSKITNVMPENTSPLDMTKHLVESNNVVLTDLLEAFALADEANEQGVANFLAERIDKHQFWNWWLTSSLKNSIG